MSPTYTNLCHWLRLWHAPKITPYRFHQILNYFDEQGSYFNFEQLQKLKLPTETLDFLKKPEQHLPIVENSLQWGQKNNCHIVTLQDKFYPPLLKQIKCPPPLLFVKGKLEILSSLQIAIVGSRKPTPIGLESAKSFANDLAHSGLTITSGLALGIDAAAHTGSLNHNGDTVAVLGSGIEVIYPYKNKKLAEKIAEKGAIVSEFPINMSPKRENFPQRNRIVSGLSLGTIVIEACLKSGSLITANFAAEQGREVFAAPGSLKNPQAQGCHYLIQQGAKLVTCKEDVLEELKGFDYVASEKSQSLENIKPAEVDHQEQKVLECLGYEPTSIDVIQKRSQLKSSEMNQILCNLKLKGYISNIFNHYIKVK
jgi:DNA processing protein